MSCDPLGQCPVPFPKSSRGPPRRPWVLYKIGHNLLDRQYVSIYSFSYLVEYLSVTAELTN